MADSKQSSSDAAKEIAAGYVSAGKALTLGSVVVGGEVFPEDLVNIPLAMINRHGLVAGATGTGKTKTLQLLAEELSTNGVPVVMADMKGDVSGISKPGQKNDKVESRIKDTDDTEWKPEGFPVEFLSLGDKGTCVPVRASISDFGHVLLGKVLGLNETQESTLGLIFGWAKNQNLNLIQLEDLKAVISYLVSDAGKNELKNIGGVSAQTAGVILRNISNLEADGGTDFFGEPEWDINDLIRVDSDGRGIISLFELADQSARPKLFSTFLMWVLATLFQKLPEIGDIDKPKLVFILDEAHLLFTDATKAFIQQVEQTVKLIRSKGVGVFLCSQLPTDIPNEILSQLGARIQHALRAFTPEDQAALAKTVKTYPNTKVYDLAKDLSALGIGEAIVTVLSEKGAPTPVAWTRMRPPHASMEALAAADITAAAKSSSLYGKYANKVDNHQVIDAINQKINATDQVAANGKKASTVSYEQKTAKQPEQTTIIDDLFKSKEAKKTLDSGFKYLIKTLVDTIFGGGGKRRR